MTDKMPQNPDGEEQIQAFVASACAGDLEAMRAQVAAGFDLNSTDRFGDTMLDRLIGDLEFFPETPKYTVVRELLQLGADPAGLSGDGSSPLVIATLNMDTEMLRILLDAGADPNAVRMYARNELLYDWADFVYRYEVWNDKLPEESVAADRASRDSWLCYLDRLAMKYGKRRPDYLQLLRDRGALSISDLRPESESGTVSTRHGRRRIDRFERRHGNPVGKCPANHRQNQRHCPH